MPTAKVTAIRDIEGKPKEETNQVAIVSTTITNRGDVPTFAENLQGKDQMRRVAFRHIHTVTAVFAAETGTRAKEMSSTYFVILFPGGILSMIRTVG